MVGAILALLAPVRSYFSPLFAPIYFNSDIERSSDPKLVFYKNWTVYGTIGTFAFLKNQTSITSRNCSILSKIFSTPPNVDVMTQCLKLYSKIEKAQPVW